MTIPNVQNMNSPRTGQPVANQFVITTPEGHFFQSYRTLIAFRPYDHVKYGVQMLLDQSSWDYSRTTGKYRNLFIGETKKETEAKIKSGEYKLVNLN